MNMLRSFGLFLILVLFVSCGNGEKGNGSNNSVKKFDLKAKLLNKKAEVSDIPKLVVYKKRLNKVLNSNTPIMKIEGLDKKAGLAQMIAITNEDFRRDIFEKESKKALHNEIMSVRPVNSSELNKYKLKCQNQSCYYVEMYNYFYNTLVVAIVDIVKKKVLTIDYVGTGSPTINQRLKEIAFEVAKSIPEVRKELGDDLEKYPYKVEKSKCERSRHLCVAPVFEREGKFLTVIVDVTDWDVLGMKWQEKMTVISERGLQNEYVMEEICDVENKVENGDWEITYILTGSDGLEIRDVKYKGESIIISAKIVDWHICYTFKKGFGYSDACGCPMFSTAAVVAFSGPTIQPIEDEGKNIGFSLIQDFRSPVWPLMCNYRYENRFEFYNDGRFRVAGVNYGLGCGVTGWYRPVFRMDLGCESVSSFDPSGNWKQEQSEFWALQKKTTKYSKEGYLYKLNKNNGSGYFVEPSRGQFIDDGRGDHAFSYFVKKHEGKEGVEVVPTLGEHCNEDYKQGPEEYLNDEKLDSGIIMWYVPQMANDDTKGKEYCWATTEVNEGKPYYRTWKGVVGPMFIPYNK